MKEDAERKKEDTVEMEATSPSRKRKRNIQRAALYDASLTVPHVTASLVEWLPTLTV